MSNKQQRFWAVVACVFIFISVSYVSSYVLVRWRKFLVMYEWNVKEAGVVRREVGPGFDIRTTSWGRLKNELNTPIYYVYYPLVKVEDLCRGGDRFVY